MGSDRAQLEAWNCFLISREAAQGDASESFMLYLSHLLMNVSDVNKQLLRESHPYTNGQTAAF